MLVVSFFVDFVNIFFCNGISDGFLHHIRFFPISLIPSLTIFSVEVTNAFPEDKISVFDLLYPVSYKIKVRF